ncbi:uncharacterized protein [Dysidea avara]|uniref:uncharacterized protein n=1 Tax=Dysidea avara TaxID=196820 RepID=UPI0033210504
MAQWGDGESYSDGVYGDNTYDSGAINSLSPYALDPSYLPKEPEYIFPIESRRRSLGDRILPVTGHCYLSGIAVGGAWGLYEGLSTLPVGESNRLKLNTVINCCTRRGPFLANNLAVLGLIYSTTNHILCRVTEQEDSMINSVAAGTLTGALYKSTAGLRPVLIASSLGACFVGSIAVGHYIYSNRHRFLRYNTA